MIAPQTASTFPYPPVGIDTRHWQQHFQDYLQDRLAWAVAYVRQHSPAQNERHVRSFLTLLQQAHAFHELNELAVTLIAALHPWPLRWGEWDLWELELRFAAQVSADLGCPLSQAEFLTYLAERLSTRGRLTEAEEVAQRALNVARACQAVALIARAGVALIGVYELQAAYETGHTILQALERELEALHAGVPPQEFALAQAHLGLPRAIVLRKQGCVEQAIQLMGQIIEDVKSLDSTQPYLLGELHRTRGLMFWVHVHYPEAIHDLQQAMAFFAQEGDTNAEAYTQSILGLVQWSLSDLDEAERTIRRSIAYDERTKARWQLTRDVGNLALVYLSRGELEITLALLERQERLALHMGDTWELHRAKGNRAVVRLCQGQAREAYPVLQKTYDYGQQYGSREGYGMDCLALGLCHVQLGDKQQTLQLYQEALDLSRQITSPALESLALRYLATEVEAERGRTYLHQALALAQTRGRRLDIALCYLTLAHITENPERRDHYRALGVQELEAIGATGWLKQVTPDHLPHFPPLL